MSVSCYANFWSLKCFEQYMSCSFIRIEKNTYMKKFTLILLLLQVWFLFHVLLVSEKKLICYLRLVLSYPAEKKSNKQSQAHRWWTKTDAKMALIYPFGSIIQGGTEIWYYQLECCFCPNLPFRCLLIQVEHTILITHLPKISVSDPVSQGWHERWTLVIILLHTIVQRFPDYQSTWSSALKPTSLQCCKSHLPRLIPGMLQ